VETDENRHSYDEWHSQRDRAQHGNPLSFAWYRSVFREISGYNPNRILEVGCGRGEFALFLSDKFGTAEITAVDFSEVAIASAQHAAARLNKKVNFICANAESLPFSDNEFDLVVSCECMEHVPSPRIMAVELSRVTQPGGKVCLTTENYLNGMLLARLQSWLTGRPFDSGSGVQPRENLMFFWRVERWLRDAGLMIEQTESCHYQWLLLPRVDPAQLCTESFSSAWAQRLAKPFGRHYSFFARKPVD
jgi:ubiquinone/menaquinone biosynthesis C-methylase UbiE